MFASLYLMTVENVCRRYVIDQYKSLLSNNNYFNVCIVLFNHIIMFILLHILFNKNGESLETNIL